MRHLRDQTYIMIIITKSISMKKKTIKKTVFLIKINFDSEAVRLDEDGR